MHHWQHHDSRQPTFDVHTCPQHVFSNEHIKPLLPLDKRSSRSPFLRILGNTSMSILSLHYSRPLSTLSIKLPIMLFSYTLLFAILTTFVVAAPARTLRPDQGSTALAKRDTKVLELPAKGIPFRDAAKYLAVPSFSCWIRLPSPNLVSRSFLFP